MKKIIKFIPIAVIGLEISTGCSKSNDNSNSINYSMREAINGISYIGTNCIVSDTSNGSLSITGGSFTTTPSFPYLVITIGKYTGVGTYTFSTVPPYYYFAYVDSSTSDVPISAYGSVTIMATSPAITGSFSFTCSDSIKISNGSFTAKAL